MSYHRYNSYREAREKRPEPWRSRMAWLEGVLELEHIMGAPMFSDKTKMEVASAIPGAELEREMTLIYRRHVGDHFGQGYREPN